MLDTMRSLAKVRHVCVVKTCAYLIERSPGVNGALVVQDQAGEVLQLRLDLLILFFLLLILERVLELDLEKR